MNETASIPSATYRLQFNRNFTFRDATALVPYLAELGISHCYASPYLRARPGSTHGYDIIDHNTLNPEIGSADDYRLFVEELHRHGMGQILDVVPNHMGVMGSDNAWWLDVLENGEASEFADYFDIDWDPIKDELQGKVLIPILADQYGNVLESGDLKLTFDVERGEFSIWYFQHRFPVDPAEYPRILTHQLDKLKEWQGASHPDSLELQSIATAFGHLPPRRGLTAEQRAERSREKEVQKGRLVALCERSTETKKFLATNVETFNGSPEDPRTFDCLHELIKTQAYRLAQWRVAADDINYRRFFDINELAALRMENRPVFINTHHFVLELIAMGNVDGLRIDHPDGLYDPAKYLRQLHWKQLEEDAENSERPFYVIVEKILTGDEKLRKDWPIQGTTGYEFANLVNGLFVDPTAATKLERLYRSISGDETQYSDLVYSCKKLILKVALASELNVLANALSRIALANRHTCDFTLNSLRSALAEIIASFPIYRTYANESGLSVEDQRYVERAVAEGRKRSNAADLSVFDFIRRILLMDSNGGPEWYRRAIQRFTMKFQQVTAAVMAKGLEDTTFYRYHRLVSLNEVGGNPLKFGTSLQEFHETNQQRSACWPHSMLTTSTHDSKRSEDVRMRIDVLSEVPAVWRLKLRRWRDWNRARKGLVDGQPVPSRNDEYLLYQTLVGAWPVGQLNDVEWKKFVDRISEYMLKAVREAKQHTSWANTNPEYEDAVTTFTAAILERRSRNRFLADFAEFQRQISRAGMYNSLSQCLLKMTAPGVPDIYQGNEVWQFNLVDPDNRRPVDYASRQRLLEEIKDKSGTAESRKLIDHMLENLESGEAKMFLTWKTLTFRKAQRELFEKGSYVPLIATGKGAQNVVAFAREYEGRMVVVAVPRLCAGLLGENLASVCDSSLWNETQLALPVSDVQCYHDVLTGECLNPETRGGETVLPLAKMFAKFPVALLLGEPAKC